MNKNAPKHVTMPAGGLSMKQLSHFVNEGTRAHWEAYVKNGSGAIQDFHLVESIFMAFRSLWDQYNAEEIAPDKDGDIVGGYVEPLPWLGWEKFAPVANFYPDDPLEKLAKRIEQYTYLVSKTQFIWNVSRGVVGQIVPGAPEPKYTLYNSDFPALDDDFRTLRGLTGEALREFYQRKAKKKYNLPISYTLRDQKTGRPHAGKASIDIDIELWKMQDAQESRLTSVLRIEFPGGAPWKIDALGFWNAAEKAIRDALPRLDLPAVDWGAILESALTAEPAELVGVVQEEMALAIKAPASLASFIDLATFAFPSDTKSRLLHQAFGVHAPKEIKELSRILEKPASKRTAEEVQRAEAIKGDFILNQTPIHDEKQNYSQVGVTLETKVRETNSISAKAIVTLRAESPEDGSEITPTHIEDAINTFFLHFAHTFHGQGLRHWALIMKELIQNNWTYTFEVTEHIGKMRNLKAGESPSKEEKQRARNIVTYLCDTFLDVQSKRGTRQRADAQRFFFIDRIQGAADSRKGEILTIRATDELKGLFQASSGTALQYVPMLETIVREDHQDHGIAIMLYIHLSPLWRMDPVRRIRIRELFDLIGKDASIGNDHRMRDLKKLESELDFMAAQAPPYLGSWHCNGDAARPSKCRALDPFECELTLIAPDWKRGGIEQIQDRRAAFLPKPKPAPEAALTREKLDEIIKASGLSANKFAEAIGVSKGYLSKVRSGQKDLTPAMEAKIREQFGMLPQARAELMGRVDEVIKGRLPRL